MKNTRVLARVLAAVLVFGSALAGCSDEEDEDGGGIFTLTDIPAEWHGMYIELAAGDEDSWAIGGAKEIDTENLDIIHVAIVGERVDIPLWFITNEGDYIADTYTGNDTLDVVVRILPQERETGLMLSMKRFTLEAVTFANGSATASWNDGIFAGE